jgi:hypothetical protein
MSIFGRFRKADHATTELQRKAETLVSMAHAMTVGSYTIFAERLPVIYGFGTEQWDFLLTVAKVFVAINALEQLDLPSSVEEELLDTIAGHLSSWESNAAAAVEDCRAFVVKTRDGLARLDEYRQDDRFLGADAVGLWIAWNLLERAPAPEAEQERGLIRLLGLSATHGFGTWWEATQ